MRHTKFWTPLFGSLLVFVAITLPHRSARALNPYQPVDRSGDTDHPWGGDENPTPGGTIQPISRVIDSKRNAEKISHLSWWQSTLARFGIFYLPTNPVVIESRLTPSRAVVSPSGSQNSIASPVDGKAGGQ